MEFRSARLPRSAPRCSFPSSHAGGSAQRRPTITTLADGRVLTIGGFQSPPGELDSVELFTP